MTSETKKFEERTSAKLAAYRNIAAVFATLGERHEAISNVSKEYPLSLV